MRLVSMNPVSLKQQIKHLFRGSLYVFTVFWKVCLEVGFHLYRGIESVFLRLRWCVKNKVMQKRLLFPQAINVNCNLALRWLYITSKTTLNPDLTFKPLARPPPPPPPPSTHTHSLYLSLSHTHAHTYTNAHTLYQSLSLGHTHTHSLTHSLTLYHAHTHTLTPTHTHTHTHTHTRTHTHALFWSRWIFILDPTSCPYFWGKIQEPRETSFRYAAQLLLINKLAWKK